MASNIVPGNIDGTYPVAGQDNSSQGFRDNFTAIKNNFTEAASEIESLQNNKASTNASSDFNDNVVSKAVLKDIAQTVYAYGSVSSGTVTLNHENGNYQTVTINGPVNLAFDNWPASGTAGRITLDATINLSSGSIPTVTIPTSVLVADNVSGGDGSSDTFTVPNTGRYLYEFITTDAGTTILMHQLGKMYT